MGGRWRPALVGILLLAGLAVACRSPFSRQYEYEEQLYLGVDGSARTIIDASIPALVALRNLPLDPSSRTPIDRDQVRRLFAVAGCSDVRVGQPWVRKGRRFVQVSVSTRDVEQFAACGPLAWSTYRFERDGSTHALHADRGSKRLAPIPGP